MSRSLTETDDDALQELPAAKSRPAWLERDPSLPFAMLTGDEFEVLCFLMLKAKYPNDPIYYYGKTSDMGRDIIHKSESGVRLIQCKKFSKDVSPSALAAEMAKVFVNVHCGKIPKKPDEVVFFVSKDLSAQSQDLIENQAKWRGIADKNLKKFLKGEPSEELKIFAREWWPFGDRQAGIAISEDVKKYHPQLVDMFFQVHKIIDASRADVRQDMREELDEFQDRFLSCLGDLAAGSPSRSLPDLSLDVVRSSFALASRPLSNWPRTLGDSRWIDRQEAESLLEHIESKPQYSCVLLGEPGSGKSALLAHVARCLEAKAIAFLGIKADLLDVNVDSLGKLTERLQLPATLVDCVRAMAREEKVVVLIDQLDALADLVDLRSVRLNVLLDLVNQLADIPNVFVIASSRTFEFNHDARFQTIEVEKMDLALPKWESVNGILQKLGIDGTNWPDSFREILRTPQNLKIFVEHLSGSAEQKVFDSYQQMLEKFWYDKVTRSSQADEKSRLLSAVSEEMSDREVLWLPIARFDRDRTVIDQLVADGIFWLSENRMQFGFQHQTLFSHARARAVIQGEVDLCDFVIARQDALFVRPTLWSTLSYLREASPDSYLTQMERLCSESLRMHIQHLLLDFLGRLQNPNDNEETWLVNWLEKDDFKRRAILSISGSKGWFRRLKDSHISQLMLEPQGIEWQLVELLSSAINLLPEETVALLKDYWLSDVNKDQLTFRIFRDFTHWSEETVTMVCQIVERTPINEVFVTSIASNVVAHKPMLASRILATEFRRQLRELQSISDSPMIELASDATFAERLSAQWTHAPRDRFRRLLESRSGRYEMPAIAEASPLPFLDEMWPLFIETLLPTLEETHHILNRFRSSRNLLYDLDIESRPENPLFEAIRVSLRELGKIDPLAFESFVRREMACEAMLVQRFLCGSLIELTPTRLSLAFEFLTGDSRRLLIGNHHDQQGDSSKLIAKIAPDLGAERLYQLEQNIRSLTEYHANIPGETAETRRQRRKWDRERRLRLLLAIPKQLMSDETKVFFEAEKVALPTVQERMERSQCDSEFRAVVSAMSTEQMKRAEDSHILKLFDELTDDIEWGHPRHGTSRGGAIEASRALAELAKEYPERAAVLAKQLRSFDQQTPALYVVQAISESDYPSAKLFDLIRDLVKLGFGSQDFQDSVAYACRRRVGNLDGLPDDICDLLKSWLAEWTFDTSEDSDREGPEESDDKRKQSVLFDVLGSTRIPNGTYSILSALTLGFIRKKPPTTSDWLDVLERHLERPENASTWQGLWWELRMLSKCDHARAVRFLERLFARYPTMRESRFGVRLMGEIRRFLGEEAFTNFCDQFAKSDWSMGRQVKGELFGVSYIADDGFRSVNDFVEYAVASDSSVESELLKGIAFAAANLWKESYCRTQATEIFVKLAERGCPQVSQGLADLFLFDKFVPNKDSKRILRVTAGNPAIIQNVDAFLFAEVLERFVASDPDVVLKLTNTLLDQFESQSDDEHHRNFDLSDSPLTSIAITLQRMDKQLRSAGLDLFERLLTFGFPATVQTIRELDNRPLNICERAPRRRRKRE